MFGMFGIMEVLFPIMFLAVFGLAFGTIISTLVKNAKQNHKNNNSPRITAEALAHDDLREIGKALVGDALGDKGLVGVGDHGRQGVAHRIETADREAFLHLVKQERQFAAGVREGDVGRVVVAEAADADQIRHSAHLAFFVELEALVVATGAVDARGQRLRTAHAAPEAVEAVAGRRLRDSGEGQAQGLGDARQREEDDGETGDGQGQGDEGFFLCERKLRRCGQRQGCERVAGLDEGREHGGLVAGERRAAASQAL